MDSARKILGHEFPDHHRHAFDRDFLAFGDDADDRCHARSKRGGDQIGGRKRFAPAIIIEWRISDEGISRGQVDGTAVQVSFVGKFDFNHGR